MKRLFSFLVLVIALPAFSAESIDAKGTVFYKMPEGKIVSRKVVLTVPMRGEGKVILKAGGKELVAHAFKSTRQHGRVVFRIVFLDPPGAPAKSAALFQGTYVRGTNLALYYGDVFMTPYETGQEDEAAERLLEDEPKLTYQGGFGFGAAIKSK